MGDTSMVSNTENEEKCGVNEGNTNNKTDNGLVKMQRWEESSEHVLWHDDDDITLLVYSLLRATEDGKIAPNQDIDFDFPWQTVRVKDMEFVHAESFMHLMSREYGHSYKYKVLNVYCVQVSHTETKFSETLALKVKRNVTTGKINMCQIVSIKCIENKTDETVRDRQNASVGDGRMSIVKIEKINEGAGADGQSGKPMVAHVARHPVTQEEWSVIQKLRAQGKKILFLIMLYVR